MKKLLGVKSLILTGAIILAACGGTAPVEGSDSESLTPFTGKFYIKCPANTMLCTDLSQLGMDAKDLGDGFYEMSGNIDTNTLRALVQQYELEVQARVELAGLMGDIPSAQALIEGAGLEAGGCSADPVTEVLDCEVLIK